MLFLYFMVGVALAIPEITIVKQFPGLYALMKRYPIFEISFSLGLGILMAWAMGIQGGVTFAVGNVFGTMITKVWYSLRIIERTKAAKQTFIHRKTQVTETLDTLSDLVKGVKFLITLPMRMLGAVLLVLNECCAMIRQFKDRIVGLRRA